MKKKEKIIVVLKEKLFQNGVNQNQGFLSINSVLVETIKNTSFEYDRDLAEQNFAYKQIVSYAIYKYEDKFFLMQRSSSGNAIELHNKYSLGIGGHLRKDDLNKDISLWYEREFFEELECSGEYTVELLGFINDDSNAIGQLHFGVVYLITGKSDAVFIKSEFKSGVFLSILECQSYLDKLESWSKIFLSKFLSL